MKIELVHEIVKSDGGMGGRGYKEGVGMGWENRILALDGRSYP